MAEHDPSIPSDEIAAIVEADAGVARVASSAKIFAAMILL